MSTVSPPKELEYPYALAAKLMLDPQDCTHDEVLKFLHITKRISELFKERGDRISALEAELKIALRTVQLLQVEQDHE